MSNKKKEVLTARDAITELWARGNLSYFLKGKQVDLYNDIKESKDKIYVAVASRRFSKSTTVCVIGTEICLQKPNAVIKIAAPTKTQIEEIVSKVMRPLLEDCPQYLMPEWMEAKKRFRFPNGSEMILAATDGGHIETLRGGASDLCIVDEAGFASDLTYAIENVLLPTTLTTNGRIILTSTPNYKDMNHEFNINYMLPREEAGTLKKYTIYDAPMVTPEAIKQIEELYGVDSPRFKCEFLCELAPNDEKMVISEFTPEKEREIVFENPRPNLYDAYVSMDIGMRDLTAVLFAYYDYLKQAIVVEDEIAIRGNILTTDYLADLIKRKESEIFIDKLGMPIKPNLRISDNNNLILINDLFRLHNLSFITTAKDNKEAQINELKIRIKQNKLIIHPRCKNTIYHLKAAKWNKNRNGFEHVRDRPELGVIGAHVDFVDALLYLVRNVQVTKNPYPHDFFTIKGENVHNSGINAPKVDKKILDFANKVLGIKK